MTYEQKTHGLLTQANDLGGFPYPWPMVLLLVSAIVMALLAIAAAVEALLDTHR